MRVAIASLQDSGSPQTWSGVPYRLAPALERRGIETVRLGVRAQLPLRLRGYLEYQLRLRGVSPKRWAKWDLGTRRGLVFGRSDYLRLGSVRARHAQNLEHALSSENLDRVIHMGGLSVPPNAHGVVDHYLVCDATWHTIMADVAVSSSFPARLEQRLEQIERSIFSGVLHFFALSEHVADDLRSHYDIDPTRITVVGSGPGWIEPFSGSKDYTNRQILFVCKDRFEEKGGALLLEAFRLACRWVDGLTLTVVTGDGHPPPSNTPNLVWHAGLSRGPELARLFRQASLYAAPGLVEPWGLVYLEALASKTPILGLRRHAFPEIAGNGAYGFIVDDPTPEAVAAALIDAVTDPQRLRQMGQEGQRHCLANYSWDRVAEKINAVLNSRTPLALPV